MQYLILKQLLKDFLKKYQNIQNKDGFLAVENNDSFKQKDYKIWIPRLGFVKCCENLRFDGKINNVTIKCISNVWFAVVNVKIDNITKTIHPTCENQTVVGVDLGIKSMAVLSDGSIFDNLNSLKKSLRNLKRQQRSLARKMKGSNNRKKQQIKLSKIHYKISCIRKNAIHFVTSKIVKKYDKIVVEDLCVKNMIKNHCLAQSILDVSWGEFRRQLEYKALWYGKNIIIADRFFASSKICSNCGFKKKTLKLSERIFCCEKCDYNIDRDLNAAINLANYSPTLKYKESEVCGEGSSVDENLFSLSGKHKINNDNEQKCSNF
jgi:putative transposase